MENNEEKNEVVNTTGMETPELNTSGINMKDATKPKSKAPKIIILSLLVMALIIGAVFFMKSNLFASNAQRFMKLATKDQKFLDVLEEVQKEKQINTTFKVDFDRILKELGQESNQKIGEFRVENKHINQNDDFSNVTQIKMTSIDNTFELQIAKTGNIVGFNVPGITDKFIAVDLDDLEGLMNNLQKLGVNLSNIDDIEKTNENNKEQSEKIKKLIEKYMEIVVKEADPFIQKTSNVEVALDGNVEKAIEYQFDLTEESYSKILLPVLKELIKNDADMKLLLELYFPQYELDDLKKMMEDFIEQLESKVKENKFDMTSVFTMKLYEKNGKNIATVLEIEDLKIGFYVFEDDKDYQFIFDMDANDMQLRIKWELHSSNNKKDGKLGIKGNLDNERIDFTLLEYEQEILNKAEDEMIKVNKEDSILLNTVTQEELEKFAEKINKNMKQFSNIVVPNSVSERKIVDANIPNSIVDLPKEDDSHSSVELKDGYLKKALDLMDKVEVGMTEEEVIKAIGKPNREINSSNSKSFYYSTKVGNYDVDLIHVFIYNEKVSTVTVDIMSSEFRKIYLGKELNANLDDLNKVIENVKEGMTISEVEKILGTAYFRNSKDNNSNYISYTWYDAQEHNVRISFTEDKVSYIGIIF